MKSFSLISSEVEARGISGGGLWAHVGISHTVCNVLDMPVEYLKDYKLNICHIMIVYIIIVVLVYIVAYNNRSIVMTMSDKIKNKKIKNKKMEKWKNLRKNEKNENKWMKSKKKIKNEKNK